MSDHPALAALESFIHLKGADAKIEFVMYRMEIPIEVSVLELAVADLPAGWRDEPPSPKTMAVEEKWVEVTCSPDSDHPDEGFSLR